MRMLLAFWPVGIAVGVLLAALLNAQTPILFALAITGCALLVPPAMTGPLNDPKSIWPRQASRIYLAFGAYFYVASPLLHQLSGHWGRTLPSVNDDMSELLTRLVVVNLAGLVLMCLAQYLTTRAERPTLWGARESLRRSQWDSGYVYASRALYLAAVASFIAFLAAVYMAGGLRNYLVSRDLGVAAPSVVIFAAEVFPYLAFLAWHIRRFGAKAPEWRMWLSLGLLAVGLALAAGGRGSRGALIWPLIIALLIVSRIRVRLPLTSVLLAGIVGILFMYGYGFYKSLGSEAVDLYVEGNNLVALEASAQRDWYSLLLGDFGRADIQATLLDRRAAGRISLSWGETYIGDALAAIPGEFGEDAFDSKAEAGTRAQYGERHFVSESTRIYGGMGEALLNFGVAGAILSFGLVGLFLAFVRRVQGGAERSGSAPYAIYASLLVPLPIKLIEGDFDNVLVFCLKFIAVPAAAMLYASSRGRRSSLRRSGDSLG